VRQPCARAPQTKPARQRQKILESIDERLVVFSPRAPHSAPRPKPSWPPGPIARPSAHRPFATSGGSRRGLARLFWVRAKGRLEERTLFLLRWFSPWQPIYARARRPRKPRARLESRTFGSPRAYSRRARRAGEARLARARAGAENKTLSRLPFFVSCPLPPFTHPSLPPSLLSRSRPLKHSFCTFTQDPKTQHNEVRLRRYRPGPGQRRRR
jgi:hypothetical protein